MKRRKGVTVFSAFTLAFTVLAIASYLVILLVLLPKVKGEQGVEPLINAFDILARNKDILGAFTNFETIGVVPHYAVFGTLGLFVLVMIIWLIVDLRRGRKIVFFFLCSFLLALYSCLIYFLTVYPLLDFIKAHVEASPMLYVPLGGAGLGILAALFAIILFLVDLGTGKVEKQAAPTFIKEPTEEVEEGVFEEIKEEEEAKEEAPAPAPAEEAAPVAEEKAEEEEKPAEPAEEEKEEEEEKPAPKKPASKKAPAKKAEKKPAKKEEKPAKKAPAKKEPAKKESSKKEAAPKEDARKTQTIMLQNEDGNNYAKAFHVSRRAELNKWQVKATGSDKALKLFNTQKEAIEYANQLAKNQNVSVRVHSKEGKIRKHNG